MPLTSIVDLTEELQKSQTKVSGLVVLGFGALPGWEVKIVVVPYAGMG